MKNYFYTDRARENKIYVFWNRTWLNQLMLINGKYCWISLNECRSNYDLGMPFESLKKAIEYAMNNSHVIYQLDTLKELAEFISEEKQ